MTTSKAIEVLTNYKRFVTENSEIDKAIDMAIYSLNSRIIKAEYVFNGWKDICNNCGWHRPLGVSNFCPNCGADMREFNKGVSNE